MLWNFCTFVWLLSRSMQLDLPHMMAFIYWIFIQIWAPHAMWTTSKLLFLLPYVFSVNFFLDVCFLLYPINCYFYNLLTWFALIREETRGFEENQPAENKFVPLSQRVLSCAAHPLSHTIITGTQVGSYFIIWQSVSISNIIWFPQVTSHIE